MVRKAKWAVSVYAPSKHREIDDDARLLVVLRDGNSCQVHGCKVSRGLELHHVWPVTQGGKDDADNLIMLCKKHHDEIEDNGTIHSREGIREWGGGGKPQVIKRMIAKPGDWQSWVYGGARNPDK